MTLPAFAAERRAAAPLLLSAPAAGTRRRRSPRSIDISCQQCAQQQTRRPLLLLLIDGTERRTLDRFIGAVPHTMRAASKTGGRDRDFGSMNSSAVEFLNLGLEITTLMQPERCLLAINL